MLLLYFTTVFNIIFISAIRYSSLFCIYAPDYLTLCTRNWKHKNFSSPCICNVSILWTATENVVKCKVQGDSFGTRPKKMRISQRLFIRFWTWIHDYIPCFMRSMSILEEMLEMFATTVQAELNATLRVCESGLQNVLY